MQGNLFVASAAKFSPELRACNRLALTLAIQRICRRATAEGKTVMRAATLRKMERQISQLRKSMGSREYPG